MSKRTKYTKEHDQYWMQRIHSANGINWHCFFQHAGDRRHLSIPPSNQEFTAKSPKQLAAEKAKAIYLSLKVNGWDATLAKLWTNKPGKKINVTIGEYLDAVRLTTNMEARTRTGYESCLNRIVSDVFGYGEGASDRQRYDYKGGGRAEWLAKVHAVRLALLTPEKVQQWKIDFLKSANPDPISQRQKKVSCNTTLRQAKSLFAPDVLANLGNAVELPPVLPFSKIQFEPRQSLKYAGGLDIDKLIAAAGNDLAQSAPEQFKIFLLGCMAGLRRREIDLLEWSSFLWDSNEIEIKETKHFKAKSDDSYGKIQVDPEFMAIFRGFHARATGQFVIESNRPPMFARWNRYRCQPHFEKLTDWLRSKGVDGDKPVHILRKEFGSAINAKGGIHAASSALRHADINITSQFYTDKRARVTAGFGHLLKAPTNVVEMKGAA